MIPRLPETKNILAAFKWSWYMAILNLSMCYFNLAIGNIWSAAFSLVVSIGIFLMVRHFTLQRTWETLTRGAI